MDQEEKLNMQWVEKESPVAKSVTVAKAVLPINPHLNKPF